MDINFTRDPVNKNRFNVEGIKEVGEKKGIAGYHGGIIGWISAHILHKTVPVESKDKGVYYLNCKSLENWKQKVAKGVKPPENIHNQKEVEKMLLAITSPNKEEGQSKTIIKDQDKQISDVHKVEPSKQISVLQILKEGKPSNITMEQFNEVTDQIKNALEEKDWPLLKAGSFKDSISTYIQCVDDVAPLVKLTKYFKDNKDTDKVKRMLESFNSVENDRSPGDEKIAKINTYLKQSMPETFHSKLLMYAILKPELMSKRNYIWTLIDRIINEINASNFKQEKLNDYLLEYINNTISVEPFISLYKEYQKSNKTLWARLEVFIELKCDSIEKEKLERIREAMQEKV